MEETNFFSLLGIEEWNIQLTAESLYSLQSVHNEVSSKIRILYFVLKHITFCCWPVLNVKYRVYPSTGWVSSCLPVAHGFSTVCRSVLIFCGLDAT